LFICRRPFKDFLIFGLVLSFSVIWSPPVLADYALVSDDRSVTVDPRTGAFTCPDMLENSGGNPTSFWAVSMNGRPIGLGDCRGRRTRISIENEAVEYGWTCRGNNFTERFHMVPGTFGPDPECVLETTSGCDSAMLVLDLSDAEVWDLGISKPVREASVWIDYSSVVFHEGGKWYRVRSGTNGPARAAYDDWKRFPFRAKNSETPLPVADSALVLFWDAGIPAGSSVGAVLERFEPERVPVGISIDGPGQIGGTPVAFELRLKNPSLRLVGNCSVEIASSDPALEISPPGPAPGEIGRCSEIVIPFSCFSRAAVPGTVRLTARVKCDEGEYVSAREILVEKMSWPVSCSPLSGTSKPKFRLTGRPSSAGAAQMLVVADMDGRVLDRMLIPAYTAELEWTGSALPAGMAWVCYVEAAVNGADFQSAKTMFVTDPEVVEEEGLTVVRFPAVNFGYNNAALKASSFAVLKKIAALLNNSPSGSRFRVEGHTDSSGTKKQNLELSRQRAESVRDYLSGVEGFDSARFTVLGFADEQPSAPNDTEENRAKNRRVEIIIEK
jgi:outer membrane protein OmpA-like peptidoglycan-associated protein